MDVEAAAAMEVIEQHKCYGGTLGIYSHQAVSTACVMRFSLFVPPQAERTPAPLLCWLSGLTCTEENFTVKGGAYRAAARHGLMILAPDTSPRGADVPDEESYDLGQGAGFYVDATAEPWRRNFRMYSYVTEELPQMVGAHFPADMQRQGIFGHSMGGHGALVAALRNPGRYRSVSAFAPICAPTRCSWGRRALQHYLGDDESAWGLYDASLLMAAAGDRSAFPEILVDQGSADEFLGQEQLLPEQFEQSCKAVGQKLRLRMQEQYDHSYFFVSTFMEDHLDHHAALLAR